MRLSTKCSKMFPEGGFSHERIKNNSVAVDMFSQRIVALKEVMSHQKTEVHGSQRALQSSPTSSRPSKPASISRGGGHRQKRSGAPRWFSRIAKRPKRTFASRQDLKTLVCFSYKFAIDSQAAHGLSGFPPPEGHFEVGKSKDAAVPLSKGTARSPHTMGKSRKKGDV